MSEIVIDCFGVQVGQAKDVKTKADNKYLVQLGTKLKKDTGTFEITVDEKLNLFEMIQSYKDDCGMAAALLALKRGEPQTKFADDGQHGGDFTGTTNVNVAYRQAIKEKELANQIANELGIEDYSVDNIADIVAAKLKEKMAPKVEEPVVEKKVGDK